MTAELIRVVDHQLAYRSHSIRTIDIYLSVCMYVDGQRLREILKRAMQVFR